MSLDSQNLRYKLSIMYALMTIIPVLFFVYLIVQSIFPNFKVAHFDFSSIQASLIIGVIAILLMSVGGLMLMYRSISSIERLARRADILVKDSHQFDVKLDTIKTNDESEKITSYFTSVLTELQNKINQANQYAKDLAEANRKLVQLALKDGLTGIYNQTYIKERLGQELARADIFEHTLGVLMMDLDDFKKFNDTYGHLQGDEFLKNIAEIVIRCMRPTDIPSRYGGEEFVLILPETGIEAVKEVAEKIICEVAKYRFKYTGDGKSEQLAGPTVSIGISYFPKDGADMEGLIKKADDALYRAKAAGKNRWEMSV